MCWRSPATWRLSFMEGRQERAEPLERAHDLSSLGREVEAVARVIAQCNSADHRARLDRRGDRGRGGRAERAGLPGRTLRGARGFASLLWWLLLSGKGPPNTEM